eukprot:16688-Heterococcus_DN1.PRE.1
MMVSPQCSQSSNAATYTFHAVNHSYKDIAKIAAACCCCSRRCHRAAMLFKTAATTSRYY